jgi:hypothetical protein
MGGFEGTFNLFLKKTLWRVLMCVLIDFIRTTRSFEHHLKVASLPQFLHEAKRLSNTAADKGSNRDPSVVGSALAELWMQAREIKWADWEMRTQDPID